MDERPEALLKSALEKIVYFEARADQLSRDLESAHSESQRLKLELASAAQREIELRRQVAELEVRLNRGHLEVDQLGRQNDALRTERAQLIGKVLEAAEIHEAGQAREVDFDLARFIAELRGEVLAGREPAAPAAPAVAAPALAQVSATTALAQRFGSTGRLALPSEALVELAAGRHPGRREETLFGFSVRELSAPDAASRIRAAERLSALGQPAAAPALASALHAEIEPRVQTALLTAFATFAKSEGVPVVSRFVDSKSPEVRLAALRALIAIDPAQAGPHLAQATQDPDRAVRRRASLLALNLSGEAAHRLGEVAIRDADAEVRALAALVLGASEPTKSRALLQGALRDPDLKVRRAAAQSLSRLLGQDVIPVVELDEAQRRRAARRIAQLPVQAPTVAPAKPRAATPTPPKPLAATVAKVAPPVASNAPSSSRSASEGLCSAVLIEVRTAIRGRTLGDLATQLGRPPEEINDACELMLARGHLVRRGTKLFAA